MDAWKSERTGPLVIQRLWRILIPRRGGRACEGLAWCERNDVSSKRSPRKRATHLAQFLLSENLCPCGAQSTLALKTACIGSSIWLFMKMNRVCDKDMPTRIWQCYVIVVSISYVRNTHPMWVSTQNVSRPVGTTPISSAFWLG